MYIHIYRHAKRILLQRLLAIVLAVFRVCTWRCICVYEYNSHKVYICVWMQPCIQTRQEKLMRNSSDCWRSCWQWSSNVRDTWEASVRIHHAFHLYVCMLAWIGVCMFVYVNVNVYTHIHHANRYTYIFTYLHTNTHKHTQRTQTHANPRKHSQTHTKKHTKQTQTHTHTRAHAHTHTRTHTYESWSSHMRMDVPQRLCCFKQIQRVMWY